MQRQYQLAYSDRIHYAASVSTIAYSDRIHYAAPVSAIAYSDRIHCAVSLSTAYSDRIYYAAPVSTISRQHTLFSDSISIISDKTQYPATKSFWDTINDRRLKRLSTIQWQYQLHSNRNVMDFHKRDLQQCHQLIIQYPFWNRYLALFDQNAKHGKLLTS